MSRSIQPQRDVKLTVCKCSSVSAFLTFIIPARTSNSYANKVVKYLNILKLEVDNKPVGNASAHKHARTHARIDGRTTRKHNGTGAVYRMARCKNVNLALLLHILFDYPISVLFIKLLHF